MKHIDYDRFRKGVERRGQKKHDLLKSSKPWDHCYCVDGKCCICGKKEKKE